ncbi:uncharacterized [Tachysurus ichikawai]
MSSPGDQEETCMCYYYNRAKHFKPGLRVWFHAPVHPGERLLELFVITAGFRGLEPRYTALPVLSKDNTQHVGSHADQWISSRQH